MAASALFSERSRQFPSLRSTTSSWPLYHSPQPSLILPDAWTCMSRFASASASASASAPTSASPCLLSTTSRLNRAGSEQKQRAGAAHCGCTYYIPCNISYGGGTIMFPSAVLIPPDCQWSLVTQCRFVARIAHGFRSRADVPTHVSSPGAVSPAGLLRISDLRAILVRSEI